MPAHPSGCHDCQPWWSTSRLKVLSAAPVDLFLLQQKCACCLLGFSSPICELVSDPTTCVAGSRCLQGHSLARGPSVIDAVYQEESRVWEDRGPRITVEKQTRIKACKWDTAHWRRDFITRPDSEQHLLAAARFNEDIQQDSEDWSLLRLCFPLIGLVWNKYMFIHL